MSSARKRLHLFEHRIPAFHSAREQNLKTEPCLFDTSCFRHEKRYHCISFETQRNASLRRTNFHSRKIADKFAKLVGFLGIIVIILHEFLKIAMLYLKRRLS